MTEITWATATGMKAALVALISGCAAGCVTHSAGPHDGSMTITIENDTFTGSDNNYTNGLGASWASGQLDTYDGDQFVRKWGDFWAFLPFVSDDGHSTYAAWTISQEMHTPDDIEDPNPPEDDQPYAGVLYLDSLLYARSGRWSHAWELKLGVVGPASQADDTQEWFHDLIGGEDPQGWDTQLPDEPIINVGYTAAYLLTEGPAGESARWRIISLGHAGLGTYFTGVGIGSYAEIGWNLADAFGGTALREGLNSAMTVGVAPVDNWSVSFFGGVGGYGVAHYLPLDGTVFKDSRSVDSEPFIGHASLGFCLRRRGFAMSLAASFFTDTFETERERAEFGTLSLSWFF